MASQDERNERNERAFATDHLNKSLAAQTAHSTTITIGAQPLRILIQLSATAILARLLVPADFGLIAMASTVTNFAVLFTDIGLGAAIFRMDVLKQDTVSGLFFFNMAIAIGLLPFVWIAAPIAALLFHDSRLTLLIIALSFSIPLAAFGAQHTVLLLRTMSQLPLQLAGILGHVSGALAGVIAAWIFHWGYWSMVATALVATTVTSSLLWLVCPWRPSSVVNWRGAIVALRVGINVTGVSVINYFHRQLDNVLLGWKFGSVELGYYSRAYQLMLLPINVFCNSLAATIEPALSRLANDPPRWRHALLDALAITSFLGGGLASLLAVGSRPLIYLLYGPQWDRAATVFFWLSIALFAGVPSNATGFIYVSLGRTDRSLKWALIFTPVLAAAFLIALPHGGEAMAMAYAITINAMLIPAFAFATHRTPVSLLDVLGSILPMMSAGVVAAVVGFSLQFHNFPKFIDLLVSDTVTAIVFASLTGLAICFLPQYATLRKRCISMLDFGLDLARRRLQQTGR